MSQSAASRRRPILALMPLIWFAVMAYFFLTEATDMPDTDWFFALPHADKIGHFGLFAIFAATLLLAFKHLLHTSSKVMISITMLICLGWALGSEWLQHSTTQTRTGDWGDVLADLLGATAGCLAYFGLAPRLPAVLCALLLPELSPRQAD